MAKKERSKKSSNTYPADSNDADARRRTVKKILAGAGVIGVAQYWTKPIVESVILPTHGQMTLTEKPQPPFSPPPPPN